MASGERVREQMNDAERELRASMPLELEDGLKLRFATRDDFKPYLKLAGRVWPDWAGLPTGLMELLDGSHPTVDYRDHLLVEEKGGRLVSYMCLMSRQWSYGGVSFGCGHVESIGTDPDFRRRGLVRRQFEVIHQLSAARGQLMQVIWGIPWYYRQFGYSYALRNFGGGSWQIPIFKIKKLAEGETEPYRLRPIQLEDQLMVRRLHQQGMKRGVYAEIKDESYWSFLFEGKQSGGFFEQFWHIIVDADGRAIGYLTRFGYTGQAAVTTLEIEPGHAYLQVMPNLLRQMAEFEEEQKAETVSLALPINHPAGQALSPESRIDNPTQALYVRIPDVVAFLNQIRPALEANLLGSEAEGYSGELKVNCVRWGIRFEFKRGRILAIEPWLAEGIMRIHHQPRFVDDTFIQLIGGFKRCAEIMDAHPDCYMDEAAARLLDVLFPRFDGGLWFNGL